jgi:hypothetical protein
MMWVNMIELHIVQVWSCHNESSYLVQLVKKKEK